MPGSLAHTSHSSNNFNAHDSGIGEVLTCHNCHKVFAKDRLPINLTAYVLCLPCIREFSKHPTEKYRVPKEAERFPINMAFLKLLGIHPSGLESYSLSHKCKDHEAKVAIELEDVMVQLSTNLRHFKSEKGGGVCSETLSRHVQKRLLKALSAQLVTVEGRQTAVRWARSMVERIVTEVVLAHSSTAHVSSYLWSAVRARGCQFLGPSMQEDVLRLVLTALAKGELIARKTLVLFIVESMTEKYPQVSKTCVGHVVQLLYRASCFNVIKRDGESSLMQLKEEFRNYELLRREHDSQIVQIAVEAGLRVSLEQWSSLLYGDPTHRQHMDAIVESLIEPRSVSPTESSNLHRILTELQEDDEQHSATEIVECISAILQQPSTESLELSDVLSVFAKLSNVVERYGRVFKGKYGEHRLQKRTEAKLARGVASGPKQFKTRFCRDVMQGRVCPRGDRCTYAHHSEETRYAGHGVDQQIVAGIMPQQPAMVQQMPIHGQLPGNPLLHSTMPHQFAPMQMDLVRQFGESLILDGSQSSVRQPIGQSLVLPPQEVTDQPILLDNGLAQAAAAAATGQAPPPVVVPVIMHHQDVQNGLVQPSLTHALMFPSNDPGAGGTLVLPSTPGAPIGPALAPEVANIGPVQQDPGMMPVPFPVMPNMMMPAPAGATVQVQPVPCGTIVFNHGPAVPPSAAQFWYHDSAQPGNKSLKHLQSNGTKNSPNGNGATRFPDSIWEINDDQVLLARRNEIVQCLNKMRDEARPLEDDEDSRGHVSYTVANSVLFDDLDVIPNTNLELPPLPTLNTLPISYADSVVVPAPVFTFGGPRDLCVQRVQPGTNSTASLASSPQGSDQLPSQSTSHYPTPSPAKPKPSISSSSNHLRTSSPNFFNLVKTMGPSTMYMNKSTAPATVQADCSIMNITDMFEHPLVISSIQKSNLEPQASYEMVDPINMVDHVPQVIRPLSLKSDPQHIVSVTLDRILNVKERIFDVEKHGGSGSAVEKAQLKLELNIVNRQISSLDTPTKQSCLLKELEAVDKKIEDMNVAV